MNFKGSKTEENIRKALAGESIARNKYTYFGDKARQEGNTELAKMYERLAQNEAFHAKVWFKALYGEIPGSVENLKTSAAGEFEEWANMYPAFAKTAREEGFEDLAKMFDAIALIEKDHEKQFMEAFVKLTKQGEEASKVEEAAEGYRCVFCGASFDHRLDVCPVCKAIGSFEPCQIVK